MVSSALGTSAGWSSGRVPARSATSLGNSTPLRAPPIHAPKTTRTFGAKNSPGARRCPATRSMAQAAHAVSRGQDPAVHRRGDRVPAQTTGASTANPFHGTTSSASPRSRPPASKNWPPNINNCAAPGSHGPAVTSPRMLLSSRALIHSRNGKPARDAFHAAVRRAGGSAAGARENSPFIYAWPRSPKAFLYGDSAPALEQLAHRFSAGDEALSGWVVQR